MLDITHKEDSYFHITIRDIMVVDAFINEALAVI
jgi:hypothetical protein